MRLILLIIGSDKYAIAGAAVEVVASAAVAAVAYYDVITTVIEEKVSPERF